MKALALAAIMIAGCANSTVMTSAPDPSFNYPDQQSGKIEERENWCIDDTMRQSNSQFEQIAVTHDPLSEFEFQRITVQRDRAISECQTSADRARDALSAGERAEYKNRAQEERDHADLIMILTASRFH